MVLTNHESLTTLRRCSAWLRQTTNVGGASEGSRRMHYGGEMAKHGKKYRAAFEKVELRPYQLDEAFALLKQIAFAKFNETVELSMLLGVDHKHADQMARGTTVLPHGTGQTKRVLVIAQGDKQREAQEAGADFVGGDEMVEKIRSEEHTSEL